MTKSRNAMKKYFQVYVIDNNTGIRLDEVSVCKHAHTNTDERIDEINRQLLNKSYHIERAI